MPVCLKWRKREDKGELNRKGETALAEKKLLLKNFGVLWGRCRRKLQRWKGQQERKHEKREQKGLMEPDFNPSGHICPSYI